MQEIPEQWHAITNNHEKETLNEVFQETLADGVTLLKIGGTSDVEVNGKNELRVPSKLQWGAVEEGTVLRGGLRCTNSSKMKIFLIFF